METLVVRGRDLLQRHRLFSACTRWGALSLAQQRLPFSYSSHFSSSNPHRQSQRGGLTLPDEPCRTRFAPSPTGYLHLGSLRTALFNYLLARATGGQFVLRIEDTDQRRLVPDAENRLYEDLKWLGLSWDEGPDVQGPYGPYRQSERLPIYKEHADRLVREGKAYRCFCSPEDLEEHKRVAHEQGKPTLYPGTCRSISLEESDDRAARGEQFAIRFKSAETPTIIQDLVYTRYRKKDPEDDYIIMKRDGFPTYHFANVVDDRDMKITHVIRGAEWLISTPKHVEIYNAFGWTPPKFAHLGLLVDQNRQKLSKRDNSANIAWYKDNLVLPSALLNFVALLGWRGKGPSRDVMTLQEMVDNFFLKFSKGDIMVSMEKLPFLQEKHLRKLVQDGKVTDTATFTRHVLQPIKNIVDKVESARKCGATAYESIPVEKLGEPLPHARILDEPFWRYIPEHIHPRRGTVDQSEPAYVVAVQQLRFHFWEIPEAELRRSFEVAQLKPASQAMPLLISYLTAVEEECWEPKMLQQTVKQIDNDPRLDALSEERPKSKPMLLWALVRWALAALLSGPSTTEIMFLLGREETLRRLDVAKRMVDEMVAEEAAKTETPAEQNDK